MKYQPKRSCFWLIERKRIKYIFSKIHSQGEENHAKGRREKAREGKIYQAGFNQPWQIERCNRRRFYGDHNRPQQISFLKRPVIQK